MDLIKVVELIIELLKLIKDGMDANKAISKVSIKHNVSESFLSKFI